MLNRSTLYCELVELRSEVNDILQYADYYPFLSPTLLSTSPTSIEASKLRALLFEVCTMCKDKDAHEATNTQTRNMKFFLQTTMKSDSLDLRVSVHRDR